MLLALLLLCSQTLAATPLAERAWIRLLPGDLPLAGYLVVRNPDDHRLVLTGAHSPAFGQIEMHQSSSESGVARMVRLQQLVIQPGGQLVFGPGGYHLMMFARTRLLQPGDQVPVTLEFDDGHSLELLFAVREATAE